MSHSLSLGQAFWGLRFPCVAGLKRNSTLPVERNVWCGDSAGVPRQDLDLYIRSVVNKGMANGKKEWRGRQRRCNDIDGSEKRLVGGADELVQPKQALSVTSGSRNPAYVQHKVRLTYVWQCCNEMSPGRGARRERGYGNRQDGRDSLQCVLVERVTQVCLKLLLEI